MLILLVLFCVFKQALRESCLGIGISTLGVVWKLRYRRIGQRTLSISQLLASFGSVGRISPNRVAASPSLITLCVCLMACGGCYTHVVYSVATNSGTGIRYYQSSPYLLVYSDSKNGLHWQILYLPDQTKKMMVRPIAIGGRSELDLYFHNGILTGSSELSDTTELPKAIIAAV